jgi:hypothetical protein
MRKNFKKGTLVMCRTADTAMMLRKPRCRNEKLKYPRAGINPPRLLVGIPLTLTPMLPHHGILKEM